MRPHASGGVSPRLASLDAYRGFVILMMVFVNFIGDGMRNIPHWLKHASPTEDTFTFPDLVFPGFLFMVGMAIPFAMNRHVGGPWRPVLKKILWRFVLLLAAGVMYENCSRYDESIALLPQALFTVLFFLTVVVLWIQADWKKTWHTVVALTVLVLLMILFRGEVGDEYQTVYLEHTWWGILGLIGWAYLECSVIYLWSRGSGTALMGAAGAMLALYMADRGGVLDGLPEVVTNFVPIGGGLGSTAANAMLGVIVGRWFLKGGTGLPADAPARAVHRRRLGYMAIFALVSIACGYFLRPYYGISKIMATPSYTLVTTGINLTAFMGFYFLIDIVEVPLLGWLFIPAGINALWAYILPDFWDNFMQLIGLGDVWERVAWPMADWGGLHGILNAGVVSLFILALVHLGTRFGIRLKL
jgi:heparan-alpha-glucosaminide N-acetyltransferase